MTTAKPTPAAHTHAYQVVELTGPSGLRWVELPEPPAPPDRVIVDVTAAGVSYVDLLYTRGQYQVRPPLPFTPGMEAAGVVRSAPPGSGLAAGQRVAALLPYGAWQEVIAADPDWVLPLPADMTFEAGAAAALNSLTALFALIRRARAEAGETLVVHGAAGGVGVAALQVGRALGLRTVAVTSDERKAEFARECAADEAVYGEDWADHARAVLGASGANIVLDPVGGDERFLASLRLLAPEGRLLVVGFTAGSIPSVRVNRLLLRNIGVLGVASREYFEQHPEEIAALWSRYRELRESGALAEPAARIVPFAAAAEAVQEVAERRVLGKIVLSRAGAAS